MIDIIRKYFPDLSALQIEQFAALDDVYKEWNAKINVISRKDIDNLYLHHVLHSLAIAKFVKFAAGTRVLDVGTGGGFPGIPLAIMFPDVDFTLIDSVGKKLIVADAASQAAGLKNVSTKHINAMDEKDAYDYVVSRAVMNTAALIRMTYKNVSKSVRAGSECGFIVFKGGMLEDELSGIELQKKQNKGLRHASIKTKKLSDYFSEDYFAEKYLIGVLM